MQQRNKLLAPLFIKNGQVTSILTLRNNGNDTSQVRVVLNSLEGEDVGQRVLSVAGHSESRVDIDAVQMVNHRFENLGSIEVTADGETISGWVTIVPRTGSATRVLDEKLQVATEQRELAADQISPELISAPVLAIYNCSTSPQAISIDCSDVQGQEYESQMTLPPKVTYLVNACIRGQVDARSYKQLLEGDHGRKIRPKKIEVRVDGSPHEIAVWGFGAAASRESSIPRVVGISFAP